MKTIIINTAELSGAALDWAVATAVGAYGVATGTDDLLGNKIWAVPGFRDMRWDDWTPSTDWAQGGPLADEYKIMVGYDYEDGEWVATELNMDWWVCGPTPLIAAMRAIVALKMGDTVDVPEELVETTP